MTAVFDVPGGHPARNFLRDNGFDDDGDIILRRLQMGDGRTRVFINDQAASVALLRDLGRKLVEIHGQHDDRALIDTDLHRTLLDAFGGLEQQEAAVVRERHKAWRDAETALAKHRARVEQAEREGDYLRSSVEELTKLDPQPGEEEELAERRAIMMKSEKIAGDVNEAGELLSGQGSPCRRLQALCVVWSARFRKRRICWNRFARQSTKRSTAWLLRRTASIMPCAKSISILAYWNRSRNGFCAARCRAQIFRCREGLPALRDKMDSDLADLDAGAEKLVQLEGQASEMRAAYDMAAAKLSASRKETAEHLKAAVMAELPALKLERAEFIVEMTTDPEARAAEGIDTVEYWVRTNPGTRAGPMMKVASGGELSRFLLALKVALADRGSAPTLVFDEIDTGVGGAVADAIGQRLARLSGRVQVLSVTHAPQVAARASTHFLIAKSATNEDRMATSIRSIGVDERQEEIARMLAGASITDEARAAAERLLAENSALAI